MHVYTSHAIATITANSYCMTFQYGCNYAFFVGGGILVMDTIGLFLSEGAAGIRGEGFNMVVVGALFLSEGLHGERGLVTCPIVVMQLQTFTTTCNCKSSNMGATGLCFCWRVRRERREGPNCMSNCSHATATITPACNCKSSNMVAIGLVLSEGAVRTDKGGQLHIQMQSCNCNHHPRL